MTSILASLQTTHRVLMNSPSTFAFNEQTAETNVFQSKLDSTYTVDRALFEFENFVDALKKKQIEVILLPRDPLLILPDAVFPNNWFSIFFINDIRTLILYPMLNINRSNERDTSALLNALYTHGITIEHIIDLSHFEAIGLALEGTGSLVLEHQHKLAFAALSPRTSPDVLQEFVKKTGYQAICFHSYDRNSHLIYHTNVMMSIGKHFAVIFADGIRDIDEHTLTLHALKEIGKEIIFISEDQVRQLCGNILEVQSERGEPFIIMSSRAFNAFTPEQKTVLGKYGEILNVGIPTIETVGGGGVRCMMAEVF